jgi:hypothetical protein
VRTGSSYLSQSELPLTFGVGQAAGIDELIVEWPSGAREQLAGLKAGRSYVITEGQRITSDVTLSVVLGH